MDFGAAGSHQSSHGLYGQADLDQAFNSLQTVDNSSPAHHHLTQTIPSHNFDHSEALEVSEHPPYDLFSNNGSSFASQRYRANSSSSSSLSPNYGMAPDGVYSHPSFGDSVPSFGPPNNNPYDVISSVPSSYSSGKGSPLTPSDPMTGIQHSPVFPHSIGSSKDFSNGHAYPDLLPDRRLSNMSGGSYHSEFPDDYGLNNGSGYPSAVQHFQDRMGGRFQPDSRFPHSSLPPTSVPSHLQHSEMFRGVAPQATHSFRPDTGLPGYDEMPQYMGPNPHADMSLRMPGIGDSFQGMRPGQPGMGASNDLQTFIRPYLDQYVRTPNRLAFGERTVIVMSSRVAQKSYGTEKRFLCPPPTAIMIGNSWWTDVVRRGEEPKLCPPRVTVCISGEPIPQEGSIEWTSASGKIFDVNDAPTGTTYIGRCVGKQLFISDVDEKKKKVEALVKITAPASDDEPERVIGTFPSRPIKVISKPSKKRQSAKNLELCINHGSTISLFHRLRSQTVSTKYLCVSGSGSSFKGSDGAPLMGIDSRARSSTPSFIARTASWDPFVMYIVDVNKPSGGIDSPPPPPPQPDYPSPPPNAISFTNNGSQIPIYYNQTVVLQCLVSGVVSPVLIIRKVDHQTTVVGGGLQEGAKGVADHYCSPGEVCGDPVSQLHKIAFEVYDPAKGMPEPGTPGATGAFLSCMGEKVNTYRPIEGRQWNIPPVNAGATSPILPGSPVVSTPASMTGADYFGGQGSGTAASEPASPSSSNDFSNDGGRVKKGKRSTSSAGGITKNPGPKGRRRPTSAGSASSGRRGSSSDAGASSGALWQVDIGETSVWTIVGTDQVRYNFYVPPVLFDNQNAPQTGSFPIPSKPVTPFPGVVKYLPPDRAAEAPKSNCAQSRGVLSKPNPHISKMLTVYGENFNKADPIHIFFGSEPSPYVEVRCTEVLGCLPPENQAAKRRPIIMIRPDGVVFPSNIMFP
ncbi:LAG1-DNAbind-domain-containing protein [Hygrophoropsis aurantiaca]|uniref:LAG1-DNAbind-domain-containing protein n=1 Tax=Hygrophoropsis aurantiaca TaxID=72124 RepID=A0ACB8AFL2_9AGAM|nr:LAG1-DNAbind-domain-containing protein [Hygrophoropsis aurantiaca]